MPLTSPDPASPIRSSLPLVGLSLTVLLSALGTSIANVALPTIARDFQAALSDVQWIVLAYLLAITALIVGMGRIGDRFGRRRTLLAGVGIFTVASVACAWAPSLPALVAARAVQGTGAAAMMGLAIAGVADIVPKERTGRAVGLMGTMSAIGTALGPTLGGVLLTAWGWPAVFLALVGPGIAALVVGLATLPGDTATGAGDRASGLDVAGTVVLAATLALYALAMTVGWRSGIGATALLLLAAGAGLALFARVERGAESPLVRLETIRAPIFAAALATNVIVSTVLMATLVVGPFYLARRLGLGSTETGLVLSVGPAASAISGVLAGRIVDRVGTAIATRAGLAAAALGALALVVLPESVGLSGYILALILLTPGYQLFQAANTTAVMTGVEAGRRGVTSGLLNLSRNLGLVSGASVMGAVFALGAGTFDMAQASPDDVARGFQLAFGIAAALIATALGLATAAGRSTPRPEPTP